MKLHASSLNSGISIPKNLMYQSHASLCSGKVDDFRVQLDDDLINDYSEIKDYLTELRKNPEYSQVWGSRFFNVFKVDKKTEMRIVRKVHDELKEAEAFKVVYSVNREK